MLALAAAVLAARTAAEHHDALATIGKVRIRPNGVNAIPSEVTAWLDARGADQDDVRAMVREVGKAAGTEPVEESWTPPTEFDGELRDRLSELLAAPVLPTGAGHDAGILSAAGIPTAMLFVRNPTGVSHSPEEHAEPDDCRAGVDAVARVMAEFTG
jgi:N-carbamoyl-L-amino-acid hydrolase